MVALATEEELYRSCHILFGRDLKISRDFLQYLQLSGVKKAYRQKALEFHPDRGFNQSLLMQQNMASGFIDVHQAYERLVSYIESRDRSICSDPKIHTFAKQNDQQKAKGHVYKGSSGIKKDFGSYKYYKTNKEQSKPSVDEPLLDPKSLYNGPLPKCQLLFGRYLYYSGLINLQTIGQALVWQRSQRPPFGEIGRRLGWLDEQDILKVLRHAHDRQLFGELALSLGILTREQLHTILLHQKRQHKRIGQYFVMKNFWDAPTLDMHIAAHRKHNSQIQTLYA